MQRLEDLLYCAGDAECPHRESAALCFDALQRWQRHEIGGSEPGGGLDVEALKLALSDMKREEGEAETQQWKAAFGDDAEISEASAAGGRGEAGAAGGGPMPDEDDGGFEVVGTF